MADRNEIELQDVPPQQNTEATPSTMSIDQQVAAIDDSNAELVNIQSLPPLDKGRKAWTFCLCAFILETLVWGFGFRCALNALAFFETSVLDG